MYHGVAQYSDEWLALRKGIPTASNAHLFITAKTKQPTAPDNKERRAYLFRLVAERILDKALPPKFLGNEHTERGREREPEAREEFEKRFKCRVLSGGFFTTDNPRLGCSPDGRFGDYEAVEIKSLSEWEHVRYMVDGPDDKYWAQMQCQLMIGQHQGIFSFDRIHFWSYCPPFTPVYRVIERDERYIGRLLEQLTLFSDEVDTTEKWVRRQGNLEVVLKAMNDND